MANRKPKVNRRGRGSKSTNARKPKVDQGMRGEEIVRDDNPTSNNPQWYMNVPPLVRDSAMIPFGTPMGKPITVSNAIDLKPLGGTYSSTGVSTPINFPGICGIDVVPTIGSMSTKSDPVNIAAQKIYAMVRRTKSGTLPYDAPDVMMYVMAMGQLYSFHNWMRRVYGYINTYSSQNIYIPRAFARMDGVDYDDLRQHMSDFRYYINSFGLKLSTYLVPQDMDIFKRYAFLYEGIYRDEAVDKAQFYMFVPHCFLKYDETNYQSGSALVRLDTKAMTNDDAGCWKFSDIYAYGEELINAIIYSEDANTISGDILRGYEAGALFKPADTPENYSVFPVYDPVVLGQIHNITVTGDFRWKTGSAKTLIYQDPDEGIIKSELYRIGNSPLNDIIDCVSEVPSPAEILENTRFKWTVDTADKVTFTEGTGYRLICGSEVVVRLRVLRYTNDNTWGWYTHDNPMYMATASQTASTVANYTAQFTKFAFFPLIQMFVSSKTIPNITAAADFAVYLLGDINNCAHLSKQNIIELHNTALLSLFNV